MTEYVMFASARSYVHISAGKLVARVDSPMAAVLRRMGPGDHVIPVFDASVPSTPDDLTELAALCAEFHVGDQLVSHYADIAGTVPFILDVQASALEEVGTNRLSVDVDLSTLGGTLTAADFVRLRALDDHIASQFKSSTPSRPIAEVSRGLLAAVRAAALPEREEDLLLRQFSLVEAQTAAAAADILVGAGRAPREGDQAFLVTRATMPGVVTAGASGEFSPPLTPIARTPGEIRELLIEAQQKALPSDPFNAEPAIAAADRLIALLNSESPIADIDDFQAFYPFRRLSQVVTQAIELAKRPLPEGREPHPPDLAEGPPVDGFAADTAAALQGLSVEAVYAELPEGFIIERSVVAAAVAALRAGKNLLLGGPPGTGKTTLAEALCRAVVGVNYDVTTATADWTTFDTIGGYLPDEGGLRFVPGTVLRSFASAGWLVIDEVNRADIDKAFGPLFTVLSGGDGNAGRSSTLPYLTADGKPVTIQWADTPDSADGFTITPNWRLLGTLNVSDKASLFRLSFAFLRRFAVLDVPLPSDEEYHSLFERWFRPLGREDHSLFTRVAMVVAKGPVAIGPAIGRDFARLIVEGLAETASGTPTFANDVEAILAAVRLLIVPQYEGQPSSSGTALIEEIRAVAPTSDPDEWQRLEVAFSEVALT